MDEDCNLIDRVNLEYLKDEFLQHGNSLGSYNHFTKAIKLKKIKGLEKIKGLTEVTLLSLTGYIGEKVDLKIGKQF